MISMIAGMVIANSRLTRSAVSIRSRLATSKRSSSWRVRTKARMTRTPESVSRMTRLMRSIFFCIAWNSGRARLMTRPITSSRIGMITSRIPVSGTSWRRAMMTPPMTIIGADSIIVSASRTTCWTWVTSLVLRVMRLAAPKWLTSTWLNVSTLRNSPLRTSRPKPMATLALKNTATIAAIISAPVTRSIRPPVRRM